MAWKSTSNRTSPLPRNWKELRRFVLKRDGYQCTAIRGDTGQRCTERATDVDHVGDDADHSPKNLTSLCAHHHRRKTGAQGGAAIRQRERTVAPKHPGLR